MRPIPEERSMSTGTTFAISECSLPATVSDGTRPSPGALENEFMSKDETSAKPPNAGSQPDSGASPEATGRGKPSRKRAKQSARQVTSRDARDQPSPAHGDQPTPVRQESQQGSAKSAASQEGRPAKGDSSRRGGSRGSSPKTGHGHDADEVAKYAWKIYLAEISEEGVRLVDDRAARELARRCFELAVTFLDEQQRQA